jgi:multidrug efflux pump subunit AcrA (membrane-fusion protein)
MTVIVRAFRRHPGWYISAFVVVLLVVVATVWLAGRSAATAEPELATARTGTLDRTVVITGTVQPSQRADLNFPAGGEVVSVTVTVGQQVAAGQPLAAVDAASLSGQVAQARSALASAEARLAADRDAGASSSQIAADRAAVDSAQAQLDVAVENESAATLTAPFAGTVAAVNVTVGEQVSAGGLSSGGSASGSSGATSAAGGNGGSAAAALAAGGSGASGTTDGAAVVVVSTGSYIIEATVDDTQVGQLQPGQQANITPNGAVTPIPGTVESVALVATSTSGVASYPVTITVTGSPPGLHIGSSAQVEVVTERITNAVLVPSAAVRGSGADATVQVAGPDGPLTRPVTVGVTSGGRTQILSGLASGDQVLLPVAAEAPAPSGGLFGGGGGGGQQQGGNDQQENQDGASGGGS